MRIQRQVRMRGLLANHRFDGIRRVFHGCFLRFCGRVIIGFNDAVVVLSDFLDLARSRR